MSTRKSAPRFASLKARFVKRNGVFFLDLHLSRADGRALKAMARAAGQDTPDFIRRLVEEEWARRHSAKSTVQ